MSQRRVLIVDDDEHMREVLQLWFANAGFEALLATDGEEALRILGNSERLDLVLTDFMMPERNGIELVRLIKANANFFETPVVVMSNNADPEFRKRATDLGAAAYLLKTEGARVVAEKAVHTIAGPERRVSTSRAQPRQAAQVRAMQQSLLALIRLAAQNDRLPFEVKSALTSAEKLAESMFEGAEELER